MNGVKKLLRLQAVKEKRLSTAGILKWTPLDDRFARNGAAGALRHPKGGLHNALRRQRYVAPRERRLVFARVGGKWIAVAALAVVACIVLFVAAYGTPLTDIDSLPKSIAWRAHIFARKATGAIPDLSWSELWQMTRARRGFGLGGVVSDGRSLEGSVSNPYFSDEDRHAGEQIYREKCSGCHGDDGSGLHGPPLNGPSYKHGDSDLALYRIVRDGIPDTSMPPADLDLQGRWQVVAYLRTMQLKGSTVREDGLARPRIHVDSARLRAAGTRGDEWLTYSGSLDGRRYSPLAQINTSNVARLRVKWVRQFTTTESKIQATPLVVDGVMFVTEPPAGVVALDARSGQALWSYKRKLPPDLPICCGRVNRGLAIHGHTLYFASLDGYLVALNANTGSLIWETKVVDTAKGYSLTGAPLVANDSVVVGVAGSEFGIRGLLSAYDAATGRLRWQFNTIPGPGEPGHETWENDAWRTGGGSTWTTGSFDPSLGIVYWGVGNPAPVFAGDARPGDNLFTNSVLALEVSSGKLVWHFQFTPHDNHDWDSAQTPILTHIRANGAKRNVICWANRNGFYYVLDRVTGEYLSGTPFVEQNWANGLDATGRPMLRVGNDVSVAGRRTSPGAGGGTNWQNPAYDEQRGLVFVPATEGASIYTKSSNPRRGDGNIYLASSGSDIYPRRTVVRALDVATGAQRWERYGPPLKNGTYGGLLATGGGLLFGASTGEVFALDSTTGQELWRVLLGGETAAPPITFAIDGRQVIALAVGRAMFVFEL